MKISILNRINIECNKCGFCCKDTEMEISRNELIKIEKLGFSGEKFTEIKNGFLKLKNINGFCYFYEKKTKKCIIYENRPLGCRFYPVILFDNECIIDKDCSCYEKNKNLKIPKRICDELKKYIEILDKEIKARIKE
ncbi:MAG: hypothetical protein GF329_05955 [Candidatus Lokiarchaeota archaeon]|nr:hypothetical protein [Candidatus Lokiarchaeota archaeon]